MMIHKLFDYLNLHGFQDYICNEIDSIYIACNKIQMLYLAIYYYTNIIDSNVFVLAYIVGKSLPAPHLTKLKRSRPKVSTLHGQSYEKGKSSFVQLLWRRHVLCVGDRKGSNQITFWSQEKGLPTHIHSSDEEPTGPNYFVMEGSRVKFNLLLNCSNPELKQLAGLACEECSMSQQWSCWVVCQAGHSDQPKIKVTESGGCARILLSRPASSA